MDWLMVIAPLAVAVLGLAGFLAGGVQVFRGKFGKATAGLSGGGLLAIGGLAFGLIGLNVQGYARLTHEVIAAEVTVHADDPAAKLYTVTVKRLDGVDSVQPCHLQGDAWEIGGRFQKWKPWANIIGLDATYTLDQISNRYNTAMEGNGKMITSCDLIGPPSDASRVLPNSWVKWMLSHMIVEDRFFGSGVYMPMVDGARYKVIVTQFALNAEPVNDIAKDANRQRAF